LLISSSLLFIAKIQPPPSLKASGVLTDREAMETEVIKLLINSYFNITKRTVIDMIPKAIMLNLVTFAKDSLQRELLQELYKSEVLDDLMKESDHVIGRRRECVKMVSCFDEVQKTIRRMLTSLFDSFPLQISALETASEIIATV